MLISINLSNLCLAVVGMQPAGLVHLATPQLVAGSTSSDITVVYSEPHEAVAHSQNKVDGGKCANRKLLIDDIYK